MSFPANAVMLIPVSTGEVIDKITILRIKSSRMMDQQKVFNVRKELVSLEGVFSETFPEPGPELLHFIDDLQAINEKLWVIEDQIRDCERAKDFGPVFVELARAVYLTNDERARIKRSINIAVGSAFIEEKSYGASV